MGSDMRSLREAVARQRGTERPAHADVPPSACERFADDLPDELAPQRRAELLARAEELHPWLQGPFWLGGDVVIGGAWRNDARWEELGPRVPASLAGGPARGRRRAARHAPRRCPGGGRG